MALNCQQCQSEAAEGEPLSHAGYAGRVKKLLQGSPRRYHCGTGTIPDQDFAIRDLGRTLAVKPYEARQRVVVIDQAQAMNPQAGNSLLKLLEEPPAKTLLVLTAGNTYGLLPTIVSRCQQVRFKPIPEKTLAASLKKRHPLW